MQRKKLKLLLASLAASAILFAVPMSVAATDSSNTEEKAPDGIVPEDLSTIDPALTLSDSCSEDCIHVFVASTNNAKHTVNVISGTHTIYLRGTINITAFDDPPFRISDKANVTLALETGCTATFNGGGANGDLGFAGLQVDDSASLTIRGKGTLNAIGGDEGGAGIGGSSNSQNIGSINILDGIINATGKGGAAGIGSGYGGAAADSISISGGTVTATGCDGESRNNNGNPILTGPGIGRHLIGGNPDQNIPGTASGTVIISGGTVYAYGGKYDKKQAGGIQAQTLSSGKGSTTIYTNDEKLTGIQNASTLNAIVWKKSSSGDPANKGTVWGNATLASNLGADQSLELMTGSSFTIAPNISANKNSSIKGDDSNRIIDLDNLTGRPDITVPNKVVSLNSTDYSEYKPFKTNKEQVYNGNDFTNTILQHRTHRPNAKWE